MGGSPESCSVGGAQVTTMREITVAHSPDADDAFMFWALAHEKFPTPGLKYRHVLSDIQTLSKAAFAKTYDLTAISFHAYAHLHKDYALLLSGASIGEKYGPRVVAMSEHTRESLRGKRIAHPGDLTTAYLAMRLWLPDCVPVAMDFNEVGGAVKRGEVDAGVIIHEGQLTWQAEGFHLIRDLGEWWFDETGLPLPLGGNAIRRDLGQPTLGHVAAHLKTSIEMGLTHRDEALTYAMGFGRGLDREKADAFVAMYVNAQTIEMTADTRRAVQLLLDRGADAGIIPERVQVEFIACG